MPSPTKTGAVTWEFWLTSIVVAATPGTGALFTVAAGVARGARVRLIAAAGCTLGIVPHMALAVSGSRVLGRRVPSAIAARS
ncbi:MAG: LysE family transporter [Gordonia sp. (in: high G+C Gram-positive bacteria)]